jgi:hypothetical protein
MTLKSFEKDGLRYRPTQQVNGGQQWRCDYDDGQYSLAMVYKSKPTRQDVVDAIADINSKHDDE